MDESSTRAVNYLLEKPKSAVENQRHLSTFYLGFLSPTSQDLFGARVIFSHIMLGVNDLIASRRSYDAVMQTLECAYEDAGDGYAACGFLGIFGGVQNCLWVSMPAGGKAANSGNGTSVALLPNNREQVENFDSTALAAGAFGSGYAGTARLSSPVLRGLGATPRWTLIGYCLSPESRSSLLL